MNDILEREEVVKQWMKNHREEMHWVIEMANKGVGVTPGAGDHPYNVFLYMLEGYLGEEKK